MHPLCLFFWRPLEVSFPMGEKRSVQSLPERDFMRKHVRIFPVYSCLLLFWVLESHSSVWRLQNRLLFFLELLVQFLYFRRKNRLFRFVRFKLQPEKSLSLIMAGLPSAVSRICCCSTIVILNHLLTSCAGEMAVSACSVRNTIGNFADAIFMGVVGTISIFSGMFYGERNKNALRSTFRTACKYAMFLAVGCGGVIFLFAPMLANGILKADQTTLSATAACLRFYAISLPGEIFSQILLYHYLATEKSGLSNLICVLHNLVLVVVPAWILGMTAGLNGIWFSWFLSGILPLSVMYLFLKDHIFRTSPFLC